VSTPSSTPDKASDPVPGTPETTPAPTADTKPGATSGTKPDARPDARPADPLRGSLTSGVWVATVGLGLLLVLLVVFIAQNTQTTTVRFLGAEGEAPVSVVLLIATAAGILLTATAGTLRIWQLRRRTRKGLKRAG
jgi:uncharacterized integral membrane protein